MRTALMTAAIADAHRGAVTHPLAPVTGAAELSGGSDEAGIGAWSERLILTSGLLLALLLAMLPYLALQSYFPYGRDMQHAINVQHLLNAGWPLPPLGTPVQQYPNSYGYLAASLARLSGLGALDILKVLPVLSIMTSAAAVYVAARGMFNRRIAALALLSFAVLAYEPRSNLFAATDIDLLTGSTVLPLYLWALSTTVERGEWRWPLIGGLLAGSMIRYHALDTSIAAVVTGLFLLGAVFLRRDRLDRGLLARVGAVGAIAFLFGLPYSIYDVSLYLNTALSHLGVRSAALAGTAFPRIAFPAGYLYHLGPTFTILLLLALPALIVRRSIWRRYGAGSLMLAAWLVALILGCLTSLFLDPLRSLYLLALPGAILCGLLLDTLLQLHLHVPTKLVLTGMLAVLVIGGIASLARQSLATGVTSEFAGRQDLPSLMALQTAWAKAPQPYVLSDESGPWVPYFADGQAYFIQGGPPAFQTFGQPIRSWFEDLWGALQEPCAASSVEILRRYNVRFVYLGRAPQHWLKPGYVYNDGAALASCLSYTPIYREATSGGAIQIYELRAIANNSAADSRP